MQKLIVIGNLGADAVVKEKNGKKFLTFKVADTNKWTNPETGEVKENTTWISCIREGEFDALVPYLKKGVRVYVEGRPQYRVYSSEKERAMVAGVDLSVHAIELVGGSPELVPRKLVNPADSSLHDVTKLYWIADHKAKADMMMYGERGGEFTVDKNGFVIPVQPKTEEPNGNA